MNNRWRQFAGPLVAIRYAIAGMGPKAGAGIMASMLLNGGDLIGADLKVTYDYTYRTYSGSGPSDAIRRARDIGSITAVRVLRNEEVGRSVATHLTRYASAEDALSRIEPSSQIRLLKPGSKVASNETLSSVNLPGFDGLIVLELQGSNLRNPAGDRIVTGNVGEILVRLTFGAKGDIEELWPWSEIVSLATKQAERVRNVLSVPQD
jgi:hypothetical protein